jgi:phage/plasmid-associated DNA primase
VLFGKLYFDTFISNVGSLKRLMESKKFSVDVKCKDPVLVNFDGSIIFVSNKHPYSDKSFIRRVVVCAERDCADDMEEMRIVRLRNRWMVRVVEEEEDVIDMSIGNRQQS